MMRERIAEVVAQRFGLPSAVAKRAIVTGGDVRFVALADDGAGVVLVISDRADPEVSP